ncbi:hypothetical protein BDW67DRAFT_108887 [Aspergillus spinulosporus]
MTTMMIVLKIWPASLSLHAAGPGALYWKTTTFPSCHPRLVIEMSSSHMVHLHTLHTHRTNRWHTCHLSARSNNPIFLATPKQRGNSTNGMADLETAAASMTGFQNNAAVESDSHLSKAGSSNSPARHYDLLLSNSPFETELFGSPTAIPGSSEWEFVNNAYTTHYNPSLDPILATFQAEVSDSISENDLNTKQTAPTQIQSDRRVLCHACGHVWRSGLPPRLDCPYCYSNFTGIITTPREKPLDPICYQGSCLHQRISSHNRALLDRRLVSSGNTETSKAAHSEFTRSEQASSRR